MRKRLITTAIRAQIRQEVRQAHHITDMKASPEWVQRIGRIDRPIPLLTHDQLVDWLIYHCPLRENHSLSMDNDLAPFIVVYNSLNLNISVPHYTPWHAYDELATTIEKYTDVLQEITDLYWYWTI